MRRRTIYAVMTCGLWLLTSRDEEPPFPTRGDTVRSFVYLNGYGPDFVIAGINELRETGLLVFEVVGPEPILYPTRALVEKVLLIQKKNV